MASATPQRGALLEAAARVLAEEGPAALSTRRLAAEVGASTMAVYTWFGGMPELLRALLREGFRRFGERLRSVEPTEDPVCDLARLAAAYRSNALENPYLYDMMFGRGHRLAEPTEADAAEALGTFQILVEHLERCVDAGRFRCDPLSGARQTWALMHGLASLELAGIGAGSEPDDELYLQSFLTRAVGLGDDPAAAARSARPIGAAATGRAGRAP
jgi:AcrR family transcriptional regulator